MSTCCLKFGLPRLGQHRVLITLHLPSQQISRGFWCRTEFLRRTGSGAARSFCGGQLRAALRSGQEDWPQGRLPRALLPVEIRAAALGGEGAIPGYTAAGDRWPVDRERSVLVIMGLGKGQCSSGG